MAVTKVQFTQQTAADAMAAAADAKQAEVQALIDANSNLTQVNTGFKGTSIPGYGFQEHKVESNQSDTLIELHGKDMIQLGDGTIMQREAALLAGLIDHDGEATQELIDLLPGK